MARELATRVFSSVSELPATYLALFDAVGRENFYLSLPWFENLLDATLEPTQALRLYGIEGAEDGVAHAVLVARISTTGRTRLLEGFTSPYTTDFGLVAKPENACNAEVIEALATALAADRDSFDSLRIDCLNWDADTCSTFARALGARRFVAESHFHFGNWYGEFSGLDFATYRRSLPSALRRLYNRIGRSDGPSFRLVTDAAQLDVEIAEYERLSLLRWGYAEPHERFIAGLVHAAHKSGVLRFAVLEFEGERVASQIWIVAGGRATIFKLAHNPDFKRSFGSTCTIALMEHVLEVDGVHEVDYGRGDDDYKKTWLPLRRERWAVTAANPTTLRGAGLSTKLLSIKAAKKILKR